MGVITEPNLAVEVAQLWPAQGEWSESDYFNLPDSSRLVELSEGEIIVMPPPSDTHQKIVGALYRHLYDFVAEHNLGVLRFAPLAVRLWPGKIREPDLLFVAHQQSDRIGELVYGPPDLVVEVISPSTRKSDRHDKFYEYAQAGITEYWLVEPEERTVEVYVLEQGAYQLLVKAAGEAVVRSKVLAGLELPSDLLFK